MCSSDLITLDGHDIRNLTLESLRRQISIVSQDVVLLDATIRENLTYGLPNVSNEAVWAALDAVALKDFVASLPDGLNARVGEGSGLLSGGQKQRLSIARAILKDAPVLILDEATSALDSEAESAVKQAIDVLTKGRTVFVVAHRFSTVENADRIFAMDNGAIVEVGTKAELLARQGLFARLYTAIDSCGR